MKLTKKDYTWCYNKMRYWQDKLGMRNYDMILKFLEPEARAEVFYNVQDKRAIIHLNETYEWANKKEIEKSIFHEVCEVLLCDVYEEAIGFLSEPIIATKNHEVIRRLENLMF